MSKRISILAVLAAASVLSAAPALAADSGQPASQAITAEHVANEVLVGFAPGSAADDRAAARSLVNVSAAERLSPLAPDAELWTLPPGRSVEDAIATLTRNPNIRYAEPNYILEAVATPNDPDFTTGKLWGMYGDASSPSNQYGSQAAEAWASSGTGSSGTYVVVIDEGIQITHPDLAANTWTNPLEFVDGVDNDGNGYVDDINGWDFAGNDNTVYDGTGDDHGTHVAGTIGAVGNNGLGVAGVNWDVTMISAKFLAANGGTTDNAIKAVDYATALKKRGLNIVATSNSWGGGGYSLGLRDAIARGGEQGILFVAAAGNSGANNDTTASYPSNYNCNTPPSTFDCVVAVAAIASNGTLASFSQYGANTVDLGAPGVDVRSTVPPDGYANYSGTSMATPHVSGALALCSSMGGGLRGAALKDALITSATATPSLAGKTVTGGRLDLGAMAAKCGAATPPPPSSDPDVTAMAPTSGPVGTTVTISGTALAGAQVTFGSSAVSESVNADGTVVTFSVPSVPAAGIYTVTVSVGATFSETRTFNVTAPPGAPTIGTATPGSRSATVPWTAPTSDGGSAITSYRVTAYLQNGRVAKTVTGISPTARQYTMNGLKRGTAYKFTVAAVNGVGTSPLSGFSNSVTVV